MKKLLTAALAALLIASPVSRALAQDAAPAPAAAATGPAEEFKALFAKIREKLSAGQTSEEALAEEIKGFDAIVAKYPGQKTDELAMVVFMKARLYLEVFDNKDKALAILKQIQRDYPDTQPGQSMAEVITAIEKQMAAEAALAVGQAFPDFAEEDTAGKPLSVAGLKGKVVLVDFWATWCGPCVAELPNVTAAYDKYKAKGFEIVGISLDEDRSALDTFVKENKMTWPQYFDGKGWQNKLAQQYGIESIPATFLLDRDGKIVARNLRGPALDQELAKLLP